MAKPFSKLGMAIVHARSWSHYQICVGSLPLVGGWGRRGYGHGGDDSPSPCRATSRLAGELVLPGRYSAFTDVASTQAVNNGKMFHRNALTPQGNFSLALISRFPPPCPRNHADVFKFVRQGNVMVSVEYLPWVVGSPSARL